MTRAASECSPQITLVIGYGNELRGDDGAGPKIATEVGGWGLDRVEARAVRQLTPELAKAISTAAAVVFVDAAPADQADGTKVISLEPASRSGLDAHAGNPAALLALAQAVFGRCPPAWLVTIPAANFDFGASLSPLTESEMAAARVAIRRICGSVRSCP